MDEKSDSDDELMLIKSYVIPKGKLSQSSFPFILPKFWFKVLYLEEGDILDLCFDNDLNIVIVPRKKSENI